MPHQFLTRKMLQHKSYLPKVSSLRIFGGTVVLRKRTVKIFIVTGALLVLAPLSLFLSKQPPTPEQLIRSPESFRYEDYWTNESMMSSLKLIISEGTDRALVEKILVEAAGAKTTGPIMDNEITTYIYTKWVFPGCFFGAQQSGGTYVEARFNNKDQLISYTVGGPCL